MIYFKNYRDFGYTCNPCKFEIPALRFPRKVPVNPCKHLQCSIILFPCSCFLCMLPFVLQCKYQFFRSLRISLRIIRLSCDASELTCSYAPQEAPYLHYWASCSMLLLYVYRSLKAQIGNFLVDFIYINQLGCLARSFVRQVNNAITWNRLLWPVSWKGAKQLPIFLLLSFLFFFACLFFLILSLRFGSI